VEPEFVHCNTGGRRGRGRVGEGAGAGGAGEGGAGGVAGSLWGGDPNIHSFLPWTVTVMTVSRQAECSDDVEVADIVKYRRMSGDLAGRYSCHSWQQLRSPGDTVSYTCCPRTAFSARTQESWLAESDKTEEGERELVSVSW